MSDKATRGMADTAVPVVAGAFVALSVLSIIVDLLNLGLPSWIRTVAHGVSSVVLPTTPTEFWAAVTGVGTLALIYVAWRGLRSIKLAQKDIVTRAMRDSRQCAITRCEEFARVIIPANAEILGILNRQPVPSFVRSAAEVQFDPDNRRDVEAAAAWCGAISPDLYRQSVMLLNRLEAWAMYFTVGLADAKVASGPCAPAFCSLVVQSYAILLTIRTNKESGKYPSIVHLYKNWIKADEETGLRVQLDEIIRQLTERQARGTASGLPTPLGTDID